MGKLSISGENWQRMSADEILSTLTDKELEDGLKRGLSQLEINGWLEQTETFEGDGPERLSKSYECWSGADYSRRYHMLVSAVSDVRREISRGASPPLPSPERDGKRSEKEGAS